MQNFAGKISIIMPAYNEETHIHSNIQETLKAVGNFGCDYEIIVVDDGSEDNTYAEALKASSASDKVTVVRYDNNIGKGHALLKGFEYVNGDLISFLDADLDLHPAQIRVLFDYMSMYNTDIVIGSKRHPQSKVYFPLYRRLMSSIYYFLITILFGLPVKDTQTGLKLFKYKVLEKVVPKLLIKKYAFDLELLAIAHRFGYKIISTPVVVNFRRPYGRIRLKDIYFILIDTMAIFYRLYILKYYDKI